jgi:hypothetical protein
MLRIVEHEPGEFVSYVFLRPEKEAGKYQMILNLKQLNEFVEYHHFKMDTLETVLKLVQPGVFMASIDFTDAYYSLAIAERFCKYLRFEFENVLYEYTCLPNGLSSGPRIFTKLLKVPLAFLRETYGVTISRYIDDTLILGESQEILGQHVVTAAELFQELGFMVNFQKVCFGLPKRFNIWGFLLIRWGGELAYPQGKQTVLWI